MINISEVPGDDEPHHEIAHALGHIRPDGLWADPADTGDIHKPGCSWRYGLNCRSAKAVAFTFNYNFINGDHATDPDAFEGLKKRVSNMPARMTIDIAAGGGAELDVLASSANDHTFQDALHEANKVVDGASAFLVNETTYLGIGQVLRRLGLLETMTDAYGKTWSAFAGVPFVDVGLKADKSTEIITNTEDPGDGGADSSSIYVVNFDTVEGLHGITLAGTGMDVYDPLNGGEMVAGPQFLRRIDWPVGLFNLSQYCIARIKGFSMTA